MKVLIIFLLGGLSWLLPATAIIALYEAEGVVQWVIFGAMLLSHSVVIVVYRNYERLNP